MWGGCTHRGIFDISTKQFRPASGARRGKYKRVLAPYQNARAVRPAKKRIFDDPFPHLLTRIMMGTKKNRAAPDEPDERPAAVITAQRKSPK
jgi:hypothetical protein